MSRNGSRKYSGVIRLERRPAGLPGERKQEEKGV